MRVRVRLTTQGKTDIDVNYNYYLSSAIYRFLEISDNEYSKKLHEEGYAYGSKKFKLFTFSQIRPQKFKIQGSRLIIEGKSDLYISSPIKEFILNLAQGLLAAGVFKIGEAGFGVETVDILPEPGFSCPVKFKCLSPITTHTAVEKEGKIKAISLAAGEKKFAENLRMNLIRKYELLNGKLPEDESIDISFEQRDLEKYGRGKLIRYKDTFIKGYMVPGVLSGSLELVKVAYECGLGEKNSAGFGMVEISNT